MGKLTHWVVAEALCLVASAFVLPLVVPPTLRRDVQEPARAPFAFSLPRFVDATSSDCGGDEARPYDVDAALRAGEDGRFGHRSDDEEEEPEGTGAGRRRTVPSPRGAGVIQGRVLLVADTGGAAGSSRTISEPRPRLRPRP